MRIELETRDTCNNGFMLLQSSSKMSVKPKYKY